MRRLARLDHGPRPHRLTAGRNPAGGHDPEEGARNCAASLGPTPTLRPQAARTYWLQRLEDASAAEEELRQRCFRRAHITRWNMMTYWPR
jgi:hypothetical protein